MTEDSVVAALRAALAATPGDRPLRRHLAGVLVDIDPVAALAECRTLLAGEPDDVATIDVARRAALAAGDLEVAERYQRLLHALTGDDPRLDAPTPPALSDAMREPLHAGDALDDEAAVDELIASVFEDVEGPALRLADVAGLDGAKQRINTSFLAPLRNPKLRKMYGKSLRGGLLLYGPPGCGKTFLARAVAGEMGARFTAIGLHDVLDMWLGESERKLHEIFELCRRRSPCVLFLDEVDALGMKRSNLTQSAGRNVVVQLLSELDGLDGENDGVFVLGATNAPWDVDPALRRPGRFDRTVLVTPPDRAAREAILAFHLRDRPVGTVDLAKVAAKTDGYSGADLRLLCETATERALERSVARGDALPIEGSDLLAAASEVRPTTREWFEVAKNVALYGNESGAYDDLLAHLRSIRVL